MRKYLFAIGKKSKFFSTFCLKFRLLKLFFTVSVIHLFSFTCLRTTNMYYNNHLSLSHNIYNMIYNCPMQSYLATVFESSTLTSMRLMTRSIQTIFENKSCKNFFTFHKSCKNFSTFHERCKNSSTFQKPLLPVASFLGFFSSNYYNANCM